MGSVMPPIDLTLSGHEWPMSRLFRYEVTEDRYSVNVFPSSI